MSPWLCGGLANGPELGWEGKQGGSVLFLFWSQPCRYPGLLLTIWQPCLPNYTIIIFLLALCASLHLMQFYLKQPKSNICFCVVSIGVFKTGMKKASFQFSRYPIIQEHWVVKSKVINIYITQRIYCKKYVVEKGFLDNTDSSFARVQGQVKENKRLLQGYKSITSFSND